MKLFEEILADILSKEEVCVTFPNLKLESAEKLVEMKCFKALQKIKTIIEDDSLSDEDCFMQIEGIIRILENDGISCGNRHDFV